MAGWDEADGLRWRALPAFGVEIDQDLGSPFPAAAADRFLALFHAFGLIVARRQALAMERQIALMELIGPMLRGPDGNSHMSSEAGYATARAELSFHSDYAFTDYPIDALSLHAIDVVDNASSTRFASAERGYALLQPRLRDALEGRGVEMIMGDFDTVIDRACELRDPAAVLSAERPAILVNPRTGRPCLGVGEMHAARLIGMDWEEGRDLLREVFACLYAPDNVIEHVWQRGDIVIWDNITYQHARGSLEGAGRRILQRVAVGPKSLEELHPAIFSTVGAPKAPVTEGISG